MTDGHQFALLSVYGGEARRLGQCCCRRLAWSFRVIGASAVNFALLRWWSKEATFLVPHKVGHSLSEPMFKWLYLCNVRSIYCTSSRFVKPYVSAFERTVAGLRRSIPRCKRRLQSKITRRVKETILWSIVAKPSVCVFECV